MPLYAVDYRINWNQRTYPCEIDACLTYWLYLMNQKQGITTTTSCCGHFKSWDGLIGIEARSVYNAIKSGYEVIREPRVWNREDGAELEQDWFYIPVENCMPKTSDDICFVCLQPLTIEQKRTGVCSEHSNGLIEDESE